VCTELDSGYAEVNQIIEVLQYFCEQLVIVHLSCALPIATLSAVLAHLKEAASKQNREGEVWQSALFTHVAPYSLSF
jgi:hypothetical protein